MSEKPIFQPNDAPAGGWVHMHNMQSDYIPAHLRDAHGDHA